MATNHAEYTWTGNLNFLETTEVELPVDDPALLSLRLMK